MKEIKAPDKPVYDWWDKTVFLAGSIDMGQAKNWQADVCTLLRNEADVVLFNPRRNTWDATWAQNLNNENFVEQVTWELDLLEAADIIFMYFDPDTKSPITLLELGLHATNDKLIVVCPDGYWRKGNVQIVCNENNIICFDTFADGITHLQERLR